MRNSCQAKPFAPRDRKNESASARNLYFDIGIHSIGSAISKNSIIQKQYPDRFMLLISKTYKSKLLIIKRHSCVL